MFPFDIIHARARQLALPYLLIGGHAVNTYAEPRATLDVDLLVQSVQKALWHGLLLDQGFKLKYDGENFLQYAPPHGTSWRMDLMLVNDQTFGKLFASSRTTESFNLPMRIPSPEHLIALKLHAMVHGPAERFEKDFGDIAGIARNARLESESGSLREIFTRYGTAEIYEKFKQRIQGK